MLDSDPRSPAALTGLEALGSELTTSEAAGALESARKLLRDRGQLDVVARLFDVEIAAATDVHRRADLLLEKGQLYADDLLEGDSAVECFNQVLEIRPDDQTAQETLAHIGLERDNWEKFVEKYLSEAQASTDRGLTTSLYLSAAETFARYRPESADVEKHLRSALDVDPRNGRAALHLERLLRRGERWGELKELLEMRVEAASTDDDRVYALMNLAEVLGGQLDDKAQASEAIKKVIGISPAHPGALRVLADLYEAEENWSALVMLYTNALKAQRRAGNRDTDLGTLLQIAMLHWKRIDNIDAAEEYFRRIRKVQPGHPAALAFYREYYPTRGETAKYLQVLRQAQRSLSADDHARRKEIAIEIAELAESQLGNPEKAIDAWKGILRSDPASIQARTALRRLYNQTEKWNALLDLMKEEIGQIPEDDVEARVAGLMSVVAIYRDKLKLDVMVLNTYNAILKIDPRNARALSELADKYEQLGRWNDLITVRSKQADIPETPVRERVEILRQIAGLWSDRFGNYAQAIAPLEKLVELSPHDADALGRLKEIYQRRRQWRALIALHERELAAVPVGERREHLANVAKLASDRLGDQRMAIGFWNNVLELPRPSGAENTEDFEALQSLANLYEREKRYLALVDVLRRQREAVAALGGDEAARGQVQILERQGALLADRLGAPQLAAEAFREILSLDPSHGRALRTLRELYATAGDFDSLEALYAGLGNYGDLVDSFHAIADRLQDADRRLALLERTARIADEHFDNQDKIARAYERILSVDPKHLGAARAVEPLYRKSKKWARLMSAYEIQLEHAEDKETRLDLHARIRDLCEQNLGSKALAFQWTAKAYEIDPARAELRTDLARLGAEADAWEEVATIFDRRVSSEDIEDDEKLLLLRELGRICMTRLHEPERARDYQRRVLSLVPDDAEAMSALEDVATQLSEWPDLIGIYRRRAELEQDAKTKVELLFKMAFIEEERIADLDAAAATFEEILEVEGDSGRAMRSLAKLHEARGDWAGLAAVLEKELSYATDNETRAELHLRLGRLYEGSLDRSPDALAGYTTALGLATSHHSQLHAALETFLEPRPGIDEGKLVEVATLLLPEYESSEDPVKIARAVEVLRGAADGTTQLDYDRRLVRLYGDDLGDPERAYAACLRVLAADPYDDGNRAALFGYAATLGREASLVEQLEQAMEARDGADDPSGYRGLAADIARVHDEQLGDVEKAQGAWLRVLDIDAADDRAYDALDRIYRGSEAWQELRTLLLRQDENTLDVGRRKEILLTICDLEEGVLDNAAGAVTAYARVLELDPSHERSYKALERLYEASEQWAELEELLTREIDYTDEGEAREKLLYRRAALRARYLGDPQGAVDLLEEVVGMRRGHSDGRELLEELLENDDLQLRVSRILEPLYEQDGLWRDLVMVLRSQRDHADSPHDAVEFLVRIAIIEEERMSHERAAFETWVQALVVLPADERPREAIGRLASMLERWPDAAAAYDTALESVDKGSIGLASELLAELAQIYDQHLADTDKATTTYRRLLDVDPGNPDTARVAAVALDRLYYEEQKYTELVDIIRRQVEWADSSEDRRDLLARIAVLCEEHFEDKDGAINAWREVLGEDPDDARALDSLERLYTMGDQHVELIEILRRRVEAAEDGENKKQYLRRIAFIYEEALEEQHDAVTAHLEVLDYMPDDADTLSELARMYRRAERHTDLLDILERQHMLCDDPETRVKLTFQIGKLLHRQLRREAEGLERYAEVLEARPEHADAAAAVEALVDDEELRIRAAEVLQPIYERTGDAEKLAALLLRVADAVDDPRERLRRLLRVGQIREDALGDQAGAFAVMAQSARVAVTEVELPEILRELERLAAALDKREDLVELYEEIGPDVLDGELQRTIYLQVADLAFSLFEDTNKAREYYQRVLDMNPDDAHAMGALEHLYRSGGEHEKLYEILIRKIDLLGDDYASQAAALSEAAQLCAAELSRTDDAVMHWEQVLELTPEDKDAAGALEKLYRTSERWHDLVDLLERRLGFAFTVEEAVALRYQLGELNEHQLMDPDRAVENYSAALGGDPTHQGATAALERFLDEPGARNAAADVLEPIYVSYQDWPKLVRIYEIKLEGTEDAGERLQLTRYIARLYEDQLEDLEGAFRWYGRVFREAPGDEGVRDQLTRLATVLEDWPGLARVYQEYLDDESDESDAARTVALALAEIYDHRTGEVELGLAAYRRALQIDSTDANTFQRLEAMLIGAERWFALIDSYEEAISASMDDAVRIELYSRGARVQEEHLTNVSRAIEAYRAVLDIDANNELANTELDRLYAQESQWFELAELLLARIDRAASPEVADDLRVRLADLLETKLEDTAGAIDHYETVLKSETGWHKAVQPLERLVVERDHQERIAELLEPVYRANDWWKKLVIILDAQLQYVDDPEKRVQMLFEIAHIHETRGGDQQLALNALASAWKENPQNQDAYRELSAQAAKLGAWDQLVETLEAGIAEQYDYDLVAAVLAQIAEVHETRRGDNTSAVDAWRKVLEAKDDDPVALSSLDRLLDTENRHDELVKVLERRAEIAEDMGVRVVMLHRVAQLQQHALANVSEAIAAHKAVLNVEDTDATSLDALEELYRAEEDWNELSSILLRKIDLAPDAATERPLRFIAAAVHDEKLSDAYEAIAHMNAVLEADGGDAEALAKLDELYLREKMWPELVEILDRRKDLEGDLAARAELGYRAAVVVQNELMEAESAIRRYSDVLELATAHEGARAALDQMTKNEDTLELAAQVLERHYRLESSFDAVAALYERRLESRAYEPDQRKLHYASLVEVHELAKGDTDAAFAVWARALVETPEDQDVQSELERLAATRGAWEELATLYEARLTDMVDAELEYHYATKLAALYEDALGDLDRAADKHRKALEVASDESQPLASLDRIYERAGKHEQLAEILAREADATMDDAAQAEFLFRLGDVRERALADVPGAVSAYRDVLDRSPRHGAARGALDRLLQTAESERSEIVGILEPLYESEGDFGRLVDLLLTKLTIVKDPLDRAQVYARVAELAEQQLSDPVRALDAAGGWLAEDPGSEQGLAEVERLAEMTGRWGEVAARLTDIVNRTDFEDVKRRLLVKLGEVQLDRLGDDTQSEVTFKAVLELSSDSTPALASLERIYRHRGDALALTDVLWKQADLTYDGGEKRSRYVEVAELREQLGDVDGAITAWREVLDLEEGDHDAHARLAGIYEAREEWQELIDILSIAARYAAGVDAEKALRIRIAQLYQHGLGKLDEAVDAWQTVLDVEPNTPEALSALEEVHTQREDWLAVQEVLVRQIDFAEVDADRIVILRRLAQLSETKRDSLDEAIGYLYQILDIDNAHFETYAEFEGVLKKAERWHDLVELLERLGDVYGTLDHGTEEIACLARAADVWEGPLDNADAAGEILEKILRREPNYVPALTRLAKIYENAGDWAKCGETLQKALQLGPTGSDAADLYFRLGEVERQQTADMDQALRYWGEALKHDAGHIAAIKAVETEARDRADWAVVADMVTRREAASEDAAEKLELTLELSDLYGTKLGQPTAVIPLLERAVSMAPDDARVLGPLADLYFGAGRHGDAAPIYERLADEAKKARKMRDVAKYRQRLGGIFEAAGDVDKALTAYEEAFRVNPTHVPTMAGLGRIYLARENWDKARRVFRSMVLQNLDPSVGITKAEVYYNLGVIHQNMDEPNKAKGMYQRGLELEPDNAVIRQALESL